MEALDPDLGTLGASRFQLHDPMKAISLDKELMGLPSIIGPQVHPHGVTPEYASPLATGVVTVGRMVLTGTIISPIGAMATALHAAELTDTARLSLADVGPDELFDLVTHLPRKALQSSQGLEGVSVQADADLIVLVPAMVMGFLSIALPINTHTDLFAFLAALLVIV